jgi:hypothetical protein
MKKDCRPLYGPGNIQSLGSILRFTFLNQSPFSWGPRFSEFGH